ncbi:acid phosphatase [Penicillium argentinense]|uniref:acid phosphatase n=1 Tax=Penicillium argentinense TaxID=1131581 RepID=A0A9W9EPY2_9EURO|nr:acid phosphatase [Penicillium argentinense]KAJ5085853.1 acid phosphatase [Penicillium argentinense]
MKVAVVTILAGAVLASAEVATTSLPPLKEIHAAAATTLPESPTSDVKGLAFDRFYQIWIENIDYNDSEADTNQQWLASQGILLTNFWALTHPSEPNYCASVGGDTFGMDNDNFNQIPENVSSIVDLLDTRGISWGEYQEHLPYPGYQGFNFSDQETYAPDYVRKHNPLVLFNSVVSNDTKARQMKNFTSFDDDLKNKKLPQWAFITPNMTNDAHDTNITFASKWERPLVEKLLKNDYFMKDTLLLLTYDEDKTYIHKDGNRIFSILVGGAVPEHLKGTKDNTFYTHYSMIASVSANWKLPSLGRWDCGANLLELVANKTGYVNYDVDTSNLLLNETYPGPMADGEHAKFSPDWPVPLTTGNCSAGHGILDIVKKTYAGKTATYNYTSPYPWDAKAGYNNKVTATRKAANSTGTSTTDGDSKKNVGVPAHVPFSTILIGLVLGVPSWFI